MFKNLWNEKHKDDQINNDNLHEIWKQLKDKMKSCKDEFCWGEKLVTRKPHFFAPKSPAEWKKDKNAWVSNFDIEKVLKQYKETYPNFDYLEPTPIDFDKKIKGKCVTEDICELDIEKKMKKGINKIGISINLDNHKKDGSHWVTVFIDLERKFIFYFDSCGDKVPKEIKILMDRVEEQCKKLGITMEQHDTLNVHHQTGTSECGMYSLFCIIELLKGKSLDYFKKHRIKDDDVAQFRKIYFN